MILAMAESKLLDLFVRNANVNGGEGKEVTRFESAVDAQRAGESSTCNIHCLSSYSGLTVPTLV